MPSISPTESHLAEVTRTHIDQVFPGHAQRAPALAYFSEQSLVSLLAAAYCESLGDSAATDEHRAHGRWQRLATCIEARLGDPELSIDAVSKELSISRRLTQRLVGPS